MKEICKARRPVATLLCALLCAPILFGAVLAEAMVTLQFEDYVQFGMFSHRQESGNYDGTETPVLWQVRSADVDNPVLLTHYLVDKKQWAASTAGMSRPLEGNAWTTSSDLRLFLNSMASGGFLEHFTLLERTAMGTTFAASDSGGAYVERDRITLPSLADINNNSLMGFRDDTGRIAKFKGANSNLIYWLRSAGSYTIHPCAACVASFGNVLGVGDYVSNELGVRPASQISLNLIIFKSGSDLSSPPSAEGGESSNPYVLYPTSADLSSASLSVSGNKLTVSFDQPAAHAYTDTANSDLLAKKFTVSDNQGQGVTVSGVAFEDGKLVLTLGRTVVYGESFSVAYESYADTDTDGIGLLTDRTVVKSLGGGAALAVINKTPNPATTPGDITVTVDGVTYYASQQPDDSSKYLILLPVRTNASVLNSLAVTVALPDEATISPGSDQNVDFSNGSVTFTITAQDGTTEDIEIEVRIGYEEGVVVSADKTQFDASVTYNADGTVSVVVLVPFAEGFDPTTIAAISAAFAPLTDITFVLVDADGNEYQLTPRRAGNAYLRINATAADVAALNSAELSSISYWLTGDDTTEYRQIFDPPIKLVEDMDVTYTNDPPSNNSSGVGCSAGLGYLGALGLFALIAPLTAARRRRR